MRAFDLSEVPGSLYGSANSALSHYAQYGG
jgi:hypothetical protein